MEKELQTPVEEIRASALTSRSIKTQSQVQEETKSECSDKDDDTVSQITTVMENENKIKELQLQQEDLIKSIVMSKAIFENVCKEKEGEYSEEFMLSIKNTPGVFVREFREIEDPYKREEFIMSLHRKSACFEQILEVREKEGDEQF